jgi:hypothetical protein
MLTERCATCDWSPMGYIQPIDIKERLEFLQYAMTVGQGDRILGQILYDLEDYVFEFFDEEDPYCHELFPEEEERKCTQRQFPEKVERFLARYKKGLRISPLEVSSYLEDWLAADRVGPQEGWSSAERRSQESS